MSLWDTEYFQNLEVHQLNFLKKIHKSFLKFQHLNKGIDINNDHKYLLANNVHMHSDKEEMIFKLKEWDIGQVIDDVAYHNGVEFLHKL